MKRLLTLAAAALITGTVLTPGFAQDKMGKMQCAECAKMSKKAGKPMMCAACKKKMAMKHKKTM